MEERKSEMMIDLQLVIVRGRSDQDTALILIRFALSLSFYLPELPHTLLCPQLPNDIGRLLSTAT